MSIDSYFKRSTKMIDNESTPECSHHPSESLGLTTAIPAMQVTPSKGSNSKEQEQPDNSLLSWSWTLPIGLADVEEREEQERTKTELQRGQEKQSLHRRQPTPSSSPQWTWCHTSSQTQWCRQWWWCICRHFKNSTRQGGKQREAHVAAPATKKQWAANTYRSGCCGTLLFSSLQYSCPKTFPRAQPSS